MRCEAVKPCQNLIITFLQVGDVPGTRSECESYQRLDSSDGSFAQRDDWLFQALAEDDCLTCQYSAKGYQIMPDLVNGEVGAAAAHCGEAAESPVERNNSFGTLRTCRGQQICVRVGFDLLSEDAFGGF